MERRGGVDCAAAALHELEVADKSMSEEPAAKRARLDDKSVVEDPKFLAKAPPPTLALMAAGGGAVG